MGAGLGLSSDDHELPDDADEAGLETTGGKILITPGATIPLRDDAAEDDDLRDDAEDLRDDAGEADLLGLSSKRSPATLPTGRF